MKIRGSDIVVRALEDEGARFAFGIPGTHNIELYDALERSGNMVPVLVTDEQSASFMADAVSRASSSVGVVNVVPGAGVTHCLSGVAEAFMDNIPIVVLACGVRSDTGKAYQLHDVDQLAILKPITKEVLKPQKFEQIYPVVRQAFRIARSGTPGPVAVEIPANFYLTLQDIPGLVFDESVSPAPEGSEKEVESAARLLRSCRRPLIYAGYGARQAAAPLRDLAEKISAPVATTIQGKGVFPESHPLWLWNGLGASAPPFVQKIERRSDLFLAVGCRFGEVATASYGFRAPENLIHVDINRDVFNRNYPAKICVQSDAAAFLKKLLQKLNAAPRDQDLLDEIQKGHRQVREEWMKNASRDRVTPARFFESLQKAAGPRAIYAADSGNGTFLGMEHLRLEEPGCFIGPIDYSCMGYAIPAAIGAKFVHPDRDVVALAGDGALLMTGLELLTASAYGAAPAVFVLRDGELGQIVQFQRTSLNRDTCGVLPAYRVEDFARTVNAEYLALASDRDLDRVVSRALEAARTKKPAMVEVAIDYSRKSFFTKGVLKTNFWRLSWPDRLQMLRRAAARRLSGLSR